MTSDAVAATSMIAAVGGHTAAPSPTTFREGSQLVPMVLLAEVKRAVISLPAMAEDANSTPMASSPPAVAVSIVENNALAVASCSAVNVNVRPPPRMTTASTHRIASLAAAYGRPLDSRQAMGCLPIGRGARIAPVDRTRMCPSRVDNSNAASEHIANTQMLISMKLRSGAPVHHPSDGAMPPGRNCASSTRNGFNDVNIVSDCRPEASIGAAVAASSPHVAPSTTATTTRYAMIDGLAPSRAAANMMATTAPMHATAAAIAVDDSTACSGTPPTSRSNNKLGSVASTRTSTGVSRPASRARHRSPRRQGRCALHIPGNRVCIAL